jgi:hypothetical protein
MKKWIFPIAVISLFLVVAVETAAADEYLYGRWRYLGPDGSIIYEFSPGGQGKIIVSPRKSSIYPSGDSIIYDFSYFIEKKIVAESPIDSFREYHVKMSFGFLEGMTKIKFGRDGKIEISDLDGRMLILTRIAELT